ncbi:hypothetical protein [Oceanirhabdus sp. W0125-5]|uniref:hypothetical protein n=1 Tax=Oceanirhabdus sp. W0125-5 TaxID=2999116 RepID=UPI0022F33B90|nr:hypothetical protein [Oceanirhabdus sp. W0125-5]WBW98095.1 hypothetical protein OW730_04835 [Oceanirhabdus sp. W0125-5]
MILKGGSKLAFKKIYSFFNKHWILTAIIITIPNYWFIFLQFYGKTFELIKESGELSYLSSAVFYILFLISLSFALSKAYEDRYNANSYKSQLYNVKKQLNSYKFILSSYNSISTKEYSRILSELSLKKSIIELLDTLIIPTTNLDNIIDELTNVLSNFSKITNKNDIAVSIIVKRPSSEEWVFYHSQNMYNNISVNNIINSSASSVNQIISGACNTLFYPDKKSALKKGIYLPDLKDKEFDVKGSIFCRNISVSDMNQAIFVPAILCISTYGVQLCENDDELIKNLFLNQIIPSFEKIIKIQLSYYYIKNNEAKNETAV